ncbi:hypothetical protein KUCAC02_010952 [Chaenocephalus aceratus]|uniref:Uncharacterized protein n=1 Tax=Chaenocephalus aceratus TaxID=36190 RepID=A0ACB9WW22_CHAAC|nr:hypothetical protein KUCAC02_010952 [Chaenocephalus aceratus]
MRALRVTVGPAHAQSSFFSGIHNNTPKRASQSRPSAHSSIVPGPVAERGWFSGTAAGDANDSEKIMALDIRRFPNVQLVIK